MSDALTRATTGFRALFLKGLDSATRFYPDLCMDIGSTAAIEEYVIPKELGTIRHWVGDRHLGDGGVFSWQVKNKPWEVTREVPREAIEDDNASIGLYSGLMEELGGRAAAHGDVLLAEMITSGLTGTVKSYDGVALFSANHPIKGDVQSNVVTGALSATTFNSGYAALLSMKDYDGQPLNVAAGELQLMVGPANRATAAGIVDAPTLASGAANINYKAAKLVVNPHLTGTTWTLARAKAPLRPFIFQMRRKPALVVKNQATDDAVFMRNKVLYGVDGRWNLGPAFYQLIVGGTGA